MGEVLLVSGYSGDLNDLLIGFLGSYMWKPGRGRIFLYSFCNGTVVSLSIVFSPVPGLTCTM